MTQPASCPCGSGALYAACCRPLHTGAEVPTTPEQLMRSRYSAFAIGDAGYLLRTWHPRTRPGELDLDPGISWLSLQVIEAGPTQVEFIARYRGPSGRGFLRERSRFEQQAGRWFYLDGTTT